MGGRWERVVGWEYVMQDQAGKPDRARNTKGESKEGIS